MQKRRVVITGIGMVTPLGLTTAETWENAKAGKSGIGKISLFDASAFAAQIGGEAKGFDPSKTIDAKEARRLDRYSQLALAAGVEAWADAGLADHKYDTKRMGCVFGVGVGGLRTLEENHETYLKSGPRRISPFLIPAMIPNMAAGHLGIRFKLHGPNFVTTSACSSSAHAIGESARMISYGVQDVMVTGGSEASITPMSVGGFSSIKALSFRNDAPEKASRPFDKDRDGFVLGEGGVVLILEELENAKKRGAKIYAEVLGYAASCDADHITAPSTHGPEQSMREAIASAGLKETDIQYVNAHGTSTPLGDANETKAVKNVFKEYAKKGLMVSSTKSMTGHLLGGAGAIESALTALMIKNGVLLPTINLDSPDAECDLDYIPNTARELKVKYALSNSFGFGGTNASVLLGAY